MDCVGKSGGLFLLWSSDVSFSLKIHIDGWIDWQGDNWRFIGFYGFREADLKHQSWSLLSQLHGSDGLGLLKVTSMRS